MSKYGSNDTLSVDQLSSLLEALKDGGDQNLADSHGATSDNGDHACYVNPDTDSIPSASEACLKEKCLTAEEIVSFHSLPNRSTINSVTLKKISPTLLYQAQNKKCFIPRLAKSSKSKKPTKGEVWGYGILFVTITNICALLGVLLVPFMNKFFYKKLLIFMVALAVGTLAGSALFFLIPDSFGLAEYDEEGAYIWKGLTVLGGIYLFFILEYTMKAIMYRKEKKKERRRTYEEIATLASVQTHTHVEVDPELKVPPEMKEGAAKYGIMQGNESSADLLDDNGREEGEENDACNDLMNGAMADQSDTNNQGNQGNHGHSHYPISNAIKRQSSKSGVKKPKIAPVAWMIIFGDAVHNFIDGLSIGAAFTESIYLGISVSVAVICEELPHELGDFAILLNAGMSRWQAVGYNFLSACACYLGLILGILVSEATAANEWVFALAGGMFLYISLADMMPEVNHATEDEQNVGQGKTKIFIIQNLGLLTGFGVMLLLALYGGNINFESS
ncbi:zinc transporter ZIP14 isoform X2 [Lingula anatina]|uniref:Zinc transporter ZIP14 isoform X2 n=1 Tax=Lingula anatina TaxID=7574 RepID=A0A1S3GZ26_LINAN|nr:zinc transporter ZIP14 isoform X2 [Lingula anatina]|eukprot:XP_013379013.1 zinc transporter ZIP14 isoform X2 [Lingula anatina]